VRRLLPEDPAVRQMALATLVNTIGNGCFFTLSALYFTRIVGLSAVEVGLGLSIAAGVALFAGVPTGHLADRYGPREVQVVLLVALTALSGLYLVVSEWWQFVAVATFVSVTMSGAGTVRSALIAGLVQGTDRSSTKAYLRAITNVGMTIGTGLAAVALHLDTREAYLGCLAVNVATFAVTALMMARVPHVAPTPADEALGMLTALRDAPYVAVVLASAVLTMHFWILEIALPLWVVDHTDAPRWIVSVLMVVNTGAVVLAQVAVARRVGSVRSAVRATALSGVLFLGACAVFGTTSRMAAGLAAAVLVLGAAVHVAGELLQSAGSFVFSFELPPEGAMGQYQGVWGLNFGIASFIAPTLIALLPLALGMAGWLALGGILLAASLLVGPAVRWAERTPRHSIGEIATAA
jgi:Na+/melibiose symporter-like transporter